MTPVQPTMRVRPTALQQAWLQEMGIDRRLLSLVAPPDPGKAIAACVPDAPDMGSVKGTTRAVPAVSGGAAAVRPLSPQASFRHSPAEQHSAPARGRPVVPASSASAQVRPQATEPEPFPPAETLQALAEQAAACQRCRLHEGRGAVVFGAGATAPGWLVVGEAPDAHDDRAGQPFAGPAGELLRAMLHAVGIDRDSQVYATSLVKCRPLGNRPPEPDERQACAGFLSQQLAFLAPERILALGESAARQFAGPDATLESLRGKSLSYRLPDDSEVPVFVTHHPATLLMCPPLKAEAWHDLLRATGRLSEA